MTLKELNRRNIYSTDKESTHHYLDVYDKLFAPFKDREINLLEVGIATGGSLKLWEDYFSKAFIWGIDIIDEISYKYTDRVNWVQHNIKTWKDHATCFDIAIDDGSHFVEDQLAFINNVWPGLNSGGLMIIEDVHDIESNKKYFDEIGIPFEVIDLRKTGIHCSVLLIFRKC
jgi:hypothetical protein